MINLLQSVTGKLQLVTGSAGTIHVYVAGSDTDNPATPSSNFDLPATPTIISTATTTDIFATPASGKGRNAKCIVIFNAHASVTNAIQLLVNISATQYTLFACTLLVGESVWVVDGMPIHYAADGGAYATGINIGNQVLAAAGADANEYLINEAGVIKKITGTLIKAWLGNTMGNQSTAAQSPSAATLTYLTNSNIAIPVGKLRIGTTFNWSLDVTKTAAGSASRTFHVRLGTAGTTADTAIHTLTSVAGTAAADLGRINIMVTIRGPLSASCISRCVYKLDHNLAATGFSTQKTEIVNNTSGTFDATTANLIIGLSVTTGASEVITFEQIQATARNL